MTDVIYFLIIASLCLGTISLGQFGGGEIRLWEILLMLFLLLSFVFKNQKVRIIVSLPLVFACLYFCSALISGMNAIDISMWLKRMVLIIALITLFFVVSQRSTLKGLTRHMKWVLYPGIFIAILGIAEIYLIQSAPEVYRLLHYFERHQQIMDSFLASLQPHGMYILRARAFFVESNEFSLFLSLPFGFLLATYYFGHDQTQRSLINLIGLLIVFFAQIASLSRGGMLCFIAQFVAVYIVSIRSGTKINIKTFIRLIAVLAIIFIVLDNNYINEDISTLFYAFGERMRDYTSEARLVNMGKGLIVASASIPNFLIGIGVGNMDISYVWEATTSNILVDILVETGIFGLVSFIGIIVGLLFQSHKTMKNYFVISNNDLFVVFVGTYLSFIGMLAGGMTSSPHTLSFFWFICGLLLAVNEYAKLANENDTPS